MTAVTAMARRPSIAGINRDARGDAITRYLRLAALFFLLAAVLAVEDLLAADREVRDETALRGALFFAAGASLAVVLSLATSSSTDFKASRVKCWAVPDPPPKPPQ